MCERSIESRTRNLLDLSVGPVAVFVGRAPRSAAHSFYGHMTLAKAASGQWFPGWEITRTYVEACGETSVCGGGTDTRRPP